MSKPFTIILLLIFSCNKDNNRTSIHANTRDTVKKIEIKSKLTNPAFEENNIFGIWSTDLNGPHADFEITEKSFYIVDYDGDGAMSYEIHDNKIKIYYPSNEQIGLITKAKNDSLTIYWASGEHITYLRWNQ